jgi:hypothetical protein
MSPKCNGPARCPGVPLIPNPDDAYPNTRAPKSDNTDDIHRCPPTFLLKKLTVFVYALYSERISGCFILWLSRSSVITSVSATHVVFRTLSMFASIKRSDYA